MPPEGVRLHQYKAEAPARKLMKECAANLSKVYGVTMVDGFTDTGRLQGNRTHGVEREARMAEDEVAMDEMAEPEGGDGRGLGGFAAGMVFGALLGAGLALMFAPERGDKTRRRLRRRLERLRENTAEGLERTGALTRRELLRRRRAH